MDACGCVAQIRTATRTVTIKYSILIYFVCFCPFVFIWCHFAVCFHFWSHLWLSFCFMLVCLNIDAQWLAKPRRSWWLAQPRRRRRAVLLLFHLLWIIVVFNTTRSIHVLWTPKSELWWTREVGEVWSFCPATTREQNDSKRFPVKAAHPAAQQRKTPNKTHAPRYGLATKRKSRAEVWDSRRLLEHRGASCEVNSAVRISLPPKDFISLVISKSKRNSDEISSSWAWYSTLIKPRTQPSKLGFSQCRQRSFLRFWRKNARTKRDQKANDKVD